MPNKIIDYIENKEGNRFKQTEIGLIPEEWEVVKLGDVCGFLNGYAFKSRDYSNNTRNLIVIRMSNITKDGGFDLSSKGIRYFPKQRINEVQKYILKKNDLVIAMTDMSRKMGIVGHTALVDADNKYVLNQRVGKIMPTDILDIFYLHFYTNCKMFIDYIKSTCTGSVQMNTSTAAIKNARLPLPPLPEQQEITNILSTIDRKIEVEESRKSILKELFKTMLYKLMIGEIRLKDIEVLKK